MSVFVLVVLLASMPPAKTPLQEAIDCYWDLDYSCTEARLMEALVMPLSRSDLIRARLYESLVSLAYRDEPRARRAVRALLELDPDFEPEQVPPKLKTIFAQERPPPLGFIFRGGYVHSLMFDDGHDARYWFDGNGMELGGALRFPSQLSLGLSLRYLAFQPRQTRPFDGLSIWSGQVEIGGIWKLGPVYFAPGLSGGLARAETDTVAPYLGVEPFFLTNLSTSLEVIWPIWKKWNLTFRLAPEMLFRTQNEQPIVSYLLPLAVGVRYGR